MTKKIACLLVILILLPTVMIGALAEAADYIGTWYLETLISEGETYNAAALGFDMSITFTADGIAIMEAFGDSETDEWTMADGALVVGTGDEAVIFTIEDGRLVMDDDDIMYFTRDAIDVPDGLETSPVRMDAALSDFDGAWEITYAVMGTIRFPADAMGAESFMIIKDGMVTTIAYGEEETYPCAMDGYTLVADLTDQQMTFVLHENGVVTCEVSDEFIMVYERSERDPADIQDAVSDNSGSTDDSDGEEDIDWADADATGESDNEYEDITADGTVDNAETDAIDMTPYMDLMYVGVAAYADEVKIDMAMIGRYDVIFNDDGTASFTIGGTELQGATWSVRGNTVILDYYTVEYEFTLTDDGFQMNYFDTMLIDFAAEDVG